MGKKRESGEHSPVPRRALLLQFGLFGAVPTVLLCWRRRLPQFPLPALGGRVCATGLEADDDAGHVIAAGAVPGGVWSQALIQQLGRDRASQHRGQTHAGTPP